MDNIIGHIGQIHVTGLTIDVEIIRTRERYGNTDYLVRPLSGSGEIWKRSDNVSNIKATDNNSPSLSVQDLEFLSDLGL